MCTTSWDTRWHQALCPSFNEAQPVHVCLKVEEGLASGIRGIEWDAVELPSQVESVFAAAQQRICDDSVLCIVCTSFNDVCVRVS